MAQIRDKDRQKHDSLWDNEEKSERIDPIDVADGQEAFADGPEVLSVEETMASVSVESVSVE